MFELLPYLRNRYPGDNRIRASPDRSVSIATGYGLDSPVSIPGSSRFFSTSQRPDRL
jgi:hypothetical protein